VEKMNDFELIDQKYHLEDMTCIVGCKSYSITTPAVSFNHCVLMSEKEDKIFCISQKNSFDEKGLKKIVDIVRRRQDHIKNDSVISIIDAQDIGLSFFDMIVVLSSKAHNHFKSDLPSLHSKTFVAFPCHHSEFLSTDTVKDIKYLRNKIIPTLDWSRALSPRLWMWFENYDEEVKTKGKDLLIGDIVFLEKILNERLQGASGLVKIQNYRKENIAVLVSKGVYSINEKKYKDFTALSLWLRNWLAS
jgi:hypothetical protein